MDFETAVVPAEAAALRIRVVRDNRVLWTKI